MKKVMILISGALLLVAGACNKEIIPTQKEKSTELVIPADFNWRTSQDLNVSVTGLALPVDFYSTLKITDTDGRLLYSGNYNLRENLTLSLTVPSTTTELALSMGKRTLVSAISNGKVVFTFAQKDDTSDLGL